MERRRTNNLSKVDTYVFIDASNIRSACLKTLDTKISFYRLLTYLKQKYPKLKEIRYYEGISKDDFDKRRYFNSLKSAGYIVCPLMRKAYYDSPIYKEYTCPKCKYKRKIQVMKKTQKLKSNVDVYLATELLRLAYSVNKPTHIILVSCDGDYAEMIRSAIMSNGNVQISVLATPYVKDYDKNSLSTRLQVLKKELPRYNLINVATLIDKIRPRQKMRAVPKRRSRR